MAREVCMELLLGGTFAADSVSAGELDRIKWQATEVVTRRQCTKHNFLMTSQRSDTMRVKPSDKQN